MMHNRLHVSVGNLKMGKTANLSLLPIITCPEGSPCARECYARRLCISKEVMTAWMDNTAFAVNDLPAFWEKLEKWLAKNKPRYFRWHVAGDIPNARYATMIETLAHGFPHTSFVCFTKRYALDWWDSPANLAVMWSAWPGMEIPNPQIRLKRRVNGIAWQEDDPRIPAGAVSCRGTCDKCRICWNANKDVILHKH